MIIKILITGGTFDKEYNELSGDLIFKKTHLQEMLRLARNKNNIKMETVMLVDSLNMTEADRKLIAEHCLNPKEDKIVITHGTDTMEETARYLASYPPLKQKTIVLTGAMVPYVFGSSDGLFNLGAALAFVQTLPPNIYIAMNGQYFTYDNVHKDKKTGCFTKLKR